MRDSQLEIYQAALHENFPDLPITQLEYLSEGWDSVACRINQELIFRFPKRAEVVESLQREIALLPQLAPTLPLPIPQFQYIGQPSETFPFSFVGYKALPGVMQAEWPEEVRQAEWWKPHFGNFLTALHSFPVEKARAAGIRDYGPFIEPAATWHETLEDFYSAVREEIYPLLAVAQQDDLADYFEDFLDNEEYFQFQPVLVHADLWDDHVLYDSATKQLGIIDFGDMSIGDPALDVSELILPYYQGKADPTFLTRRHFYSGLPPLIGLLFGLEHEDKVLIEYGLNHIGYRVMGFP